MSRIERAFDDSRPLVLDGALGTELEARGVESGLPLWSTGGLLHDPDCVLSIHREYARAGVGALTAGTFRTQARVLARAGVAVSAAALTRKAVDLARRAAEECERPPLVLGSQPPLEDCYRPDRVPAEPSLIREHEEHAAHLAAAGVDGVLVETMNTVRETVAAAGAARRAGLRPWISFVCDADARLLSGETLADALDAVAAFAPVAVGVNCLPPSSVAASVAVLRESGLPFSVHPNLGAPGEAGRTEALEPRAFAELAAQWVEAGARAVGGCCGTTPAHLRRVVQKLQPLGAA